MIKDHPIRKRVAFVKSIMLFQQRRAIFIHIPKAAGISIFEAIYGVDSTGHHSVSEYEKFLGKKFSGYRIFTVVRNPYDRLYSGYNYLHRGGRGHWLDRKVSKIIRRYENFEDFVLNFFADYSKSEFVHFCTQSDWLYDRSQSISLDLILKLEYLDHDFHQITELVYSDSAVALNLPRRNVTESLKLDISKIYTPKMIEIVNKEYSVDFVNFGYNLIGDKMIS